MLANWEHAHCLVDRRLHDVFATGAMLFEARPLGRVGAWWVVTISQGYRGPLRRAVSRIQASMNTWGAAAVTQGKPIRCLVLM